MNVALDLKIFVTYPLAYRKRKKFDLTSTPTTKLASLVGSEGKKIDVLLFGDSVTERTSFNDQDKRTLFSMFRDGLKSGTRFYHISHSAYYADIYYLYLRYFLSLNIQPKIIILPINIRSFSPQWDYNPMFQNTDHIDQLLEMLKSEGVDLCDNDYPKKSLWQYFNSEVKYTGSDFKRVLDFLRLIASKPKTDAQVAIRKKNIYIFHYMNKIDFKHRKIAALSETVRLCSNNGIKLIIYFTPINYEAAASYVGEKFLLNLKENVNTVKEQVLANADRVSGISVIDYSTLLGRKFFFNPDETTEHLCETGRRKLSQELLDLLTVEQ